ncbi:DUF2993 domain-containing protein [Blastococcus xanthinilyticus]|uniref:DUF2993 family protein n=1 Tax=Blastococcus xanthinilyticus TaxID=1564164 RepID=A0A5S5D0I9_9ACTN|nr:DUF2993 domain-containing protein [Blastococcus xanthinilyticus]TYP89553.1 Protein of unknown function (DUF2993) [Blastococcus xanthinilyticus]
MRVLAVLLVLLVGLGVLLDRIAVAVAEDQVAAQLADRAGLAGVPAVDIRGFPFLTQAVGGSYEEVRIALTGAELGRPEGTRAEVVLREVQLPLSAVLAGDVGELPVGRIDGVATLSYDLLAEEIGGDTTLEPEGDRLRITRTVDLLGGPVPLAAVGTVSLDGDELVINVERAESAGVALPGFLVGPASDLLDLRYPIELPFGLRLTGVAPAPDGVDVRVAADDALIGAG